MNPSSKIFLVLTIFILIMSVVCLVQGMMEGGITLAVFGLLGLLARVRSKKKS